MQIQAHINLPSRSLYNAELKRARRRKGMSYFAQSGGEYWRVKPERGLAGKQGGKKRWLVKEELHKVPGRANLTPAERGGAGMPRTGGESSLSPEERHVFIFL